MGYQFIKIQQDNQIATVWLNRPERLNALNKDMVLELDGAFDGFAADKDLRCVVITGEKNFAAGADIESMVDFTPEEAKAFAFVETFAKIESFPLPVIAAIEGFALGGGLELALRCDFRVTAPNAKLGLPEINLGIFPGAGGTQKLPRLIGDSKAKKMIFTGGMIDGQTALGYGLADLLAENPLEEALKLAGDLARKAPVALRLAKQCVNMAAETELSAGYGYEAMAWGSLFATEDQKEGMRAFLEKRKPSFTGK
ncbi:MAG: enoyl-CoA hydratase/isomerase family protein [Clostridiales Family XIII bacterium]|nr:enoyl-CoA hydratase/isomerase family protein [Clostridiales Family XIII bacterium]